MKKITSIYDTFIDESARELKKVINGIWLFDSIDTFSVMLIDGGLHYIKIYYSVSKELFGIEEFIINQRQVQHVLDHYYTAPQLKKIIKKYWGMRNFQ